MKAVACFFLLAVVAALRPLGSADAARKSDAGGDGFPGWNAAPVAGGVATLGEPQALNARDARFARDFPGRIGVFAHTDEAGREVTRIVRWVTRPTRRLHPAGDCLRAIGFRITPRPIHVRADGTTWGVVTADREAEILRVAERIVDAEGRSWTDASAWFWASAFGPSRGPWWAITEISANGATATAGSSDRTGD